MTLRVEEAKATAKRVPILGLDQLRALPGPKEYDSGIYFLWGGPALLYIGKSRNLLSREYEQRTWKRYAGLHKSDRAKPLPYDRFTCLVLETGLVCSPGLDLILRTYERAYIATYDPPYNEDYNFGFT